MISALEAIYPNSNPPQHNPYVSLYVKYGLSDTNQYDSTINKIIISKSTNLFY